MKQFYLKHPTKSDFWAGITTVKLDQFFFNAFDEIRNYLKDTSLHRLSTEQIQSLTEKIDFFDNHPQKQEVQSYYKKKNKNYELHIEVPMSFGANSSRFAHEFTNLQSEIIDPLRQCLEYGETLKEIEALVKNFGSPMRDNLLHIFAKNPFDKVKIWKKTLDNNSFHTVELSSQERLYSSSAYALFIDDESSGYYAKGYGNVSLSEATLFDSQLLAKRQKAKSYEEQKMAIVEVQIQFKKIITRPDNPQDIDKLQAYHDKEAITQFFAQHSIEKLKEELQKLEAQNKELKMQQGIEDTTQTLDTKPVVKKHKI